MTTIDTGIYGAKRQSYRKVNPRYLLKTLIEEHSGSDEKQIQQLFVDVAKDDPEMIETIIEYWFAGNYRSLVKELFRKRTIAKTAVAEKVWRHEALKESIKLRAVSLVLLDFILPNGKQLRDSTGKDCAKAGGWLIKIAKAVKPAQKVGEVLSEADVRKLFRS